jgi:hypothetical protein
MINGSIPTASIHGTWMENAEVWAVDTDTPYDFSGVTEAKVRVRDLRTGLDELVLTMSDGAVTFPSLGIVQWRAELGHMSTLSAKLYEVLLVLEDETDTVPVFIGTISIVE